MGTSVTYNRTPGLSRTGHNIASSVNGTLHVRIEGTLSSGQRHQEFVEVITGCPGSQGARIAWRKLRIRPQAVPALEPIDNRGGVTASTRPRSRL